VTVGATTTAQAVFGNACYVAATFTVTSVPEGQTPFAWYRLPGGSVVTVDLDQGADDSGTTADESTTWSGTVDDVFLDTSSMAWGYGVGEDTVEVESGYDFSGSGVPAPGTGTCAVSRSVEFAPSTVIGLKFKDIDMDGVQDAPDSDPATPDEVGLAGFTFHLVDPEDPSTPVHTAVSCGSAAHPCGDDAPPGTYVFAEVEAGTYTLVEDLEASGAPAGWRKVGIATTGEGIVEEYPLTVSLGQDADVPAYGNTPLSKIRVQLQPGTDPAMTKIDAISCAPVDDTEVGDELELTESATSVDLDYLTQDVTVGTYTCTLTIVDP
jgi:hypothetical protein